MKKKILIANGHLKPGGVERSLVSFLRALDYSLYDVDLLLFEGLGEYETDIPSEVNVILLDLTGTYGSFSDVIHKADGKAIYRKLILYASSHVNQNLLKGLMKTAAYDIAIAYRVGMPLDFVSYAVKAKKKYFWWHHGAFDYPENLVKHWQKAAANMDGMVFVSETIRNTVEPYFKEYVKEMYVIPNMLHFDELQEKSTRKKVTLSNGINILSVGRFSPEKHMSDIPDVMNRLLRDGYTGITWYMIGDGEEAEEIRRKTEQYGLSEYVKLPGMQANPYPWMKDADLIVHPSHVESQGITVLEAMALGRLTVAVKSDGVCEFAKDGWNALLSEKNTESLANVIEEALSLKEETKKQISENAVTTAKRFTPANIMRIMDETILKQRKV